MKQECKKAVEKWLLKEPLLRDSDLKLCSAIWREEMEKVAAPTLFPDFLAYYASGRLTSAETIRRQRQKLQELNPLLRGKSYEERQRKQSHIRKLLGY